MTTSAAVSSLTTSGSAAPAQAQHRRAGGFDRQLQSAASAQVAQATAGALTGAASPGTSPAAAVLGGGLPGAAASGGTLLSGDLLMQIQGLPGHAAAAPKG